MRALLQEIDLLESKNVGVQGADRVGQPVQTDQPVGRRSTVEDIERRQPHTWESTHMTTMNATDTGGSPTDRLRAALKRSASALKADAVPFALAGSYALWVHGAPENTHDVDLVVAEDTTEDAVGCLAKDGFRIERPPEDWLFKAYLDGAMVDVLHRLNGIPVDAGFLEHAEIHDVLGLRIPVLPPTEVLSTKLQALTERYCDFGQLLPPVRAVREQLDWARLHAESVDNPFAATFLDLVDRLGIRGKDGATEPVADQERS